MKIFFISIKMLMFLFIGFLLISFKENSPIGETAGEDGGVVALILNS